MMMNYCRFTSNYHSYKSGRPLLPSRPDYESGKRHLDIQLTAVVCLGSSIEQRGARESDAIPMNQYCFFYFDTAILIENKTCFYTLRDIYPK